MDKGILFFNNFTILVSFLIFCIFIEMLLGREMLEKFLWLILFSVIIINSKNFVDFMKSDKTKETR